MRRTALFVLVGLVAGCGSSSATTSTSAPTPDGTPAGPTGRVEQVLDGDSLRILVEGDPIEVRLVGVNAPERGECWADEARQALAVATAGRDLVVIGTGLDQYGRLLARIHDGPTDVNRVMIEQGHALAVATEHERRAEYLAAEDDAARLGRGLWAAEACGEPLGDHGIVIWALEPDPPGRDDADPNGEWIAIANEGETPADLSGWAIRDESSVHRFVFPDGYVLEAGQIVTVRSGCGAPEPQDLHWCAATPVWTNAGDTALLLGPSGQVADRHRY